MGSKKSCFLGLLMFLSIISPAYSEFLTIQIDGIVSSVSTGPGVALDGSVAVGTPMHGSCVYDTDALDESAFDTYGYYRSVVSISMTIGNYVFKLQSNATLPAMFAVEYADAIYRQNVFTTKPRFDGTITVGGQAKKYEDIVWNDAVVTPFYLETSLSEYIPADVDALPVSFPDLSAFNVSKWFSVSFPTYSSPYFGISGELTSLEVVPEPATILLLALAGLALRRRVF